MFWILRILAGIVLLVVLVYGMGLLMSDERSVTRTTILEGLPDLVYDVLTDVEDYHLWRSDLRRLTIDERGEYWKWTEVVEPGITVRVRETGKEPAARYVIESETSTGVRGTWVGTLELSGEVRTRLTCTETTVIENPLLRLPAYLVMNVGARLDVFLGDLNRRVVDLGPKPDARPIVLP